MFWPCRLGFLMPNFFLILSASAYLTLDSFCSSAMMEMLVVSFVISSSILSLHVFLGWRPTRFLGARSTKSKMAHAVAYRRLLILVMLRSCPCLMLFRAKFARFSRISPTLLLIFTFGTGFLFFMAISSIISLFFLIRFTTSAIFSSSGVCWAAPFSY